jgi:hypothetical protein
MAEISLRAPSPLLYNGLFRKNIISPISSQQSPTHIMNDHFQVIGVDLPASKGQSDSDSGPPVSSSPLLRKSIMALPKLDPDHNLKPCKSNTRVRLTALLLHVIWVIIHCTLLIILHLHLESRIVLPLTEKSSTISTAITAASQLFVVVSHSFC